MSITLRSPLSPDEVSARMKAQTNSAWVLFHNRPLVGWVRPGEMRVRKVILLRNSFQKSLSATFEGDGAGTLIRCRFSILPHVLTFLAVFLFGFAGMVLYPVMGAVQGTPVTDTSPYVMGGGVLLLGVVLAMIGSWLARDDERFLTDFVVRATEAAVVG